eukprot:scaffold239162_cov23-Tisochrysis_lutea.AAC.1
MASPCNYFKPLLALWWKHAGSVMPSVEPSGCWPLLGAASNFNIIASLPLLFCVPTFTLSYFWTPSKLYVG